MTLTVDTTSNPIVVTGTASSAEVVTTGAVRIQWIYWLQPTTAGHKLAIQHRVSGKDVVELYCVANNEGTLLNFYHPMPAPSGLAIDDMDSGTLYIAVI